MRLINSVGVSPTDISSIVIVTRIRCKNIPSPT